MDLSIEHFSLPERISSYDVIIAQGGDLGLFSAGSPAPPRRLLVSAALVGAALRSGARGSGRLPRFIGNEKDRL